jgi:hypothetical protein
MPLQRLGEILFDARAAAQVEVGGPDRRPGDALIRSLEEPGERLRRLRHQVRAAHFIGETEQDLRAAFSHLGARLQTRKIGGGQLMGRVDQFRCVERGGGGLGLRRRRRGADGLGECRRRHTESCRQHHRQEDARAQHLLTSAAQGFGSSAAPDRPRTPGCLRRRTRAACSWDSGGTRRSPSTVFRASPDRRW